MKRFPIDMVIVVILVGLFAGCIPVAEPNVAAEPASAAEAQEIEKAEVVETVTAPATAEVLADCFHSATALAWYDLDRDGQLDRGEQPLAGIEFVLQPTVYSRTVSDENGEARIFATTPGSECPENLQVVAVGFPGYAPTTAQSLPYVDADTVYTFGFHADPISTFIETENGPGAIFSAAAAAPYAGWLYAPGTDTWTPAAADVHAFEARLAAYLDAQAPENQLGARLSAYKRQYFGLVVDGEKHLLVNYFCNDFGSPWQEQLLEVADGGDCFFQVSYKVETAEYYQLLINGEA